MSKYAMSWILNGTFGVGMLALVGAAAVDGVSVEELAQIGGAAAQERPVQLEVASSGPQARIETRTPTGAKITTPIDYREAPRCLRSAGRDISGPELSDCLTEIAGNIAAYDELIGKLHAVHGSAPKPNPIIERQRLVALQICRAKWGAGNGVLADTPDAACGKLMTGLAY